MTGDGPSRLSFAWELFAPDAGAAPAEPPRHNQWKIGPGAGDAALGRRLLETLQGPRPAAPRPDWGDVPRGQWKRTIAPLALAVRAGIEVVHHGARPTRARLERLVHLYDRATGRWWPTNVEVRESPELARRMAEVEGIAYYAWDPDTVDARHLVGRRIRGAELLDLQRCVDMEGGAKKDWRHCRELALLEAPERLVLVGSVEIERCGETRSTGTRYRGCRGHYDEVFRRVERIVKGWDATSGLLLMDPAARLETAPLRVECGSCE